MTGRLLALLALLGLTVTTAPGADNSPLAGAPLPDAQFRFVNDAARGLAGLNPIDDAAWTKAPEWQSYVQTLDGRWSYIQRVRLNAMKAWASSNLSSLDSKTVFYPFSGPDFLYANTFFPDSHYMIMAGLEPVGTLPDLAKLQQQGQLGAYLTDVEKSLYTILAASFFKTKDMKTDFNNALVDGLLPDIAVFLARQGYGIDSLQYVTLTGDGTLKAGGSHGVQIGYYKGDRDDIHYLVYLQTDLGNDGMAGSGFAELMKRLGPGVTYLKAASYLCYEDYFSRIRNAILDNSTAVLEDDSGIPLKYFKPSEWTIYPYGNYTGPIPLFKDKFQPDLAAYYAANQHPPLTFGSGYKFIADKSSLLVAKKKSGG